MNAHKLVIEFKNGEVETRYYDTQDEAVKVMNDYDALIRVNQDQSVAGVHYMGEIAQDPNISQSIIDEINTTYGVDAQYMLSDYEVEGKLKVINKKTAKMQMWYKEGIMERCETILNTHLLPTHVKVGDGVTINYWSDRHAGTIIKVTKASITVQRDKATLDPNFKPQIIEGGFAGHCTNQNEQTYTYERDEDGYIETFRWSRVNGKYCKQGITVSKGRHEFYDYNF